MKKYAILLSLLVIAFSATAQERVTPELLWKLGRIGDVQVSPDGKWLVYPVTRYDLNANKGNSDLYLISSEGGTPVKLTDTPAGEFNAVWRPDGKKIGYISTESGSAQIWEMNPDGSDKTKISEIIDGVNGFSYSPDMKHIVYIRQVKLDKTPAELYPDLPKANVRIIDDLMYRHWDSWNDYTYSHIFIADYSYSKLTDFVDLMDNERFSSPLTPYGGMEEIAWSPDGNKLAYTCRKLTGKAEALSTNSDIFIVDLISHGVRNITDGMEGYDQDPVFSPDGKKIVWSSMKTPGFESDKKRIMLYDFTNGKYDDLSASFDQSSSNFLWEKDGKTLYFISGINATYQLYCMDVNTRKIRQITKGRHDYTAFVMNQKNLIGLKMSMSMPTEIYTVDKKRGSEKQLSFTNRVTWDKVAKAAVRECWVKTTDNKEMLVWVILPPGFDSTRKYPAILFCEGGPQSAVSQFFSYRWNFQIMAANDYVIIAPNRRGLPTFGQEWNDQISLDYGGQNMKDYLSAVDSIKKKLYIDSTRIGAVGASYGAYSVYWLAGHHNKRFKAFIAHCGMFNFESWYGTTEEYWFPGHDLGGSYWQIPKPKSYDFSPHLFVKNWDTPILVISGGYDFRIPYTESMQAFNAAQLLGIPSRFLFFPEESHFVLKPQNSVLWQREFFKWLDTYLK